MKSYVRVGWIGIVASAVAFGAAPVRAADNAANGEAAALYKEGLALWDRAKADNDPAELEAARRKFAASYSLVHRPSALFSLALSEKRLKRTADAVHHFRKYLREPGAPAASLQQARAQLAELGAQTATLEVAAPEGAEIWLDGQATGEFAPLVDPLDVMPGTHAVEARHAGEVAALEVNAFAGDREAVTLAFPPSPAPVAVIPPPAEPVPAPKDPPSTPAPVASSSGFWTPLRGTGLVLLGLSVASFVGSGVFAGQAQSDANKAASERSALAANGGDSACVEAGASCSEWMSTRSSESSHHTLSAVFLGTGIGTAVVGIGLLLWPQSKESRVAIGPVMAPAHAGLRVAGEF
jgi:hypothetical protein